MSEARFHIVVAGKYLDGYDGVTYEFTENKKTAWQFAEKAAESRVRHLRVRGFTEISIVPAK